MRSCHLLRMVARERGLVLRNDAKATYAASIAASVSVPSRSGHCAIVAHVEGSTDLWFSGEDQMSVHWVQPTVNDEMVPRLRTDPFAVYVASGLENGRILKLSN